MPTLKDYRKILSVNGDTLADIRKEQSDRNINISFAVDAHQYKKVLILTVDGWKWEEIHFSRHNKQSIASDDQDYFVDFRPKVHYPVGSYMIIPDDTSPKLNLSDEELENPFLQPIEKRTQWWMIVERNNDYYVRYNVLKCNWNFEWVQNGRIWSVFGCNRNANSYTSGSWRGERTVVLDNVTNFEVPDTYKLYGEKLWNLGLYDTRYIDLNMRFILSHNQIHPKCYKVSKVLDTVPTGVIKVTLEQDEYNEKRDNPILRIADYYDNEGHCRVDVDYENVPPVDVTSSISAMLLNADGEMFEAGIVEDKDFIHLGKTSYYKVNFSGQLRNVEWHLVIIDGTNQYSESDKNYYQNLIKLTAYSDDVIAVRPGKAGSLVGKQFELIVSQTDGIGKSSLMLEVDDE